jgi:hypothetical protein
MQLLKKKTFWLPLVLFSFLFANTAQAGLILLEDNFDDGVANANGWTLLDNKAEFAAGALLVGTGFGDTATTAVFDLRYMSSVSISFDFSVIDSNFDNTRYVFLQFLSDGTWIDIKKLVLNAQTEGLGLTYQVDSGLGDFGQFRFVGKNNNDWKSKVAAIDNVTITAVSAPSITAIMFGALGLILFRRRRA